MAVAPTQYPLVKYNSWTKRYDSLDRTLQVPPLDRLWNRARQLILPNDISPGHVYGVYKTLADEDKRATVTASRLYDCLFTNAPILVVAVGMTAFAAAHYDEREIRLNAAMIRAMNDVEEGSPNEINLSFIVLVSLMHELAHILFRDFNGRDRRSDERVANQDYVGANVGDPPGWTGESGYFIERDLWGGVVDIGVKADMTFIPFRSPTHEWKGILAVALRTRASGSLTRHVVLDEKYIRLRLTQDDIRPFQPNELGLAKVNAKFKLDTGDIAKAIKRAERDGEEVARGELYLYNRYRTTIRFKNRVAD